jgi:aldehyde dehydrogenase (NAD+)
MANPNLPFGGVGYSGYGRYHGYEGFKAFSNQKSVFSKPSLNFYPYTKIYPPFTQDKQGLIRFLMKFLGCTQKQFFKRFIWLLIFLWFAKAIATGQLSMKTYRKWKNIFGMVGSMLPMLMK